MSLQFKLITAMLIAINVTIIGIVIRHWMIQRRTPGKMWRDWRAFRAERIAQRQAQWNGGISALRPRQTHEKATIIRVGTIEEIDGGIRIHEWAFFNPGTVPMWAFSRDGQTLFQGYTIAELREIAARRDEWADRDPT